jgi:hypothetical protein
LEDFKDFAVGLAADVGEGVGITGGATRAGALVTDFVEDDAIAQTCFSPESENREEYLTAWAGQV